MLALRALLTTLRRHTILLSVIVTLALVTILIHSSSLHLLPSSAQGHGWAHPFSTSDSNSVYPNPGPEHAVDKRVQHLRDACGAPDEFEEAFGRVNIRLSRGYEGSLFRLQNFVNKIMRGENVTVAALGGSVTRGHGVWESETWLSQLTDWLHEFYPNQASGSDNTIETVNGAGAAVGSDYFSFCFALHIPTDADLVLVELGVNDEALPEHYENMDNLIRGLLDLPSQPAVVLVEAVAFSTGAMGGGGGKIHLPVAQYYDVPVINQRHPLVSHFARFPELVPLYFVPDPWGNPDMRHINGRGHRDLSKLVASLLRDTSCGMVQDPNYRVPASKAHPKVVESLPKANYDAQVEAVFGPDTVDTLGEVEAGWPKEAHSWNKTVAMSAETEGDTEAPPDSDTETGGPPETDSETEAPPETEIWPGMWTRPSELGVIPRLPALEDWNPNLHHRKPHMRPICLSTRATEPRFNLTPIHADPGWDYWVHPVQLDKPYIVGRVPGARITFELETRVGLTKIYALHSASYGLGRAKCWVDNEVNAVQLDGWWGKDNLNIGRFVTLADDLKPGMHSVTCELLSETSDPSGGTEFRIISLMSL